MRPLLASAVIATRDRPRKLEDTLRGLARQTLPPDRYEIVVVDDGSSPPLVLPEARDETVARVLARVEGLGRSEARNHGARLASGGVLVFVDDDIHVGETFLEAHLAAQARWPRALLTGAIRLPETALLTPFGRFRQRLEDGVLGDRGIDGPANFAAAGNLSIRRGDFLELGGFDPALQSGEDQDLALRHSARGGRTGYLPEALGVHADDALDVRSYCRRMEWGYEHMVAFCRRHPEWPENRLRLLVNGPIHWGQDPPGAILRKLSKWALARPPAAAVAFAAVALLEKAAPASGALERSYRCLLGAFLLKGFRRGLKRYGSSQAVSST